MVALWESDVVENLVTKKALQMVLSMVDKWGKFWVATTDT